MKMRYPKLRELKEAVTAVFSPRFTTRFPAEPCVVPERYRGKPEFDTETCMGCGACVNVCPTLALTQLDDPNPENPTRTITLRYDTCIFCGNCQENCSTQTGIKLSNQWDLAGLDRQAMVEKHTYELELCEKCGRVVGTKKHLLWLAQRLGPLAYTNPSLLLAQSKVLAGPAFDVPADIPSTDETEPQTQNFMRVLCPHCKCQLNLEL